MPEFQVNANFNYSVKVPAELKGGPQYASEEFGGSITVGQTVEAENAVAAKIFGEQLVPVLANQVKTAVLVQAGLDQVTDDNGVIQPVLQTQVTATPTTQPFVPQQPQPFVPQQQPMAQPQQAPMAQPMQPMNVGGGSKAQRDAQGNAYWEGRPIKVYDNRSKVGTPEHGNKPHINIRFMDVDDSAPNDVKYKGFWMNNKDGSPSQTYLDIVSIL